MPSVVTLRMGPLIYRYQLTVSHNVHNAVVREPDMPDYAAGERVMLTAVPGAGWQFWHWRGDLHGGDNPIEIVMDGHRQVTAAFKKQVEGEPL